MPRGDRPTTLALAWKDIDTLLADNDSLRTALAASQSKVQELFDYFMGEHACGDFTCACNSRECCGTCDIRESTREFLESMKSKVETTEGEGE